MYTCTYIHTPHRASSHPPDLRFRMFPTRGEAAKPFKRIPPSLPSDVDIGNLLGNGNRFPSISYILASDPQKGVKPLVCLLVSRPSAFRVWVSELF